MTTKWFSSNMEEQLYVSFTVLILWSRYYCYYCNYYCITVNELEQTICPLAPHTAQDIQNSFQNSLSFSWKSFHWYMLARNAHHSFHVANAWHHEAPFQIMRYQTRNYGVRQNLWCLAILCVWNYLATLTWPRCSAFYSMTVLRENVKILSRTKH